MDDTLIKLLTDSEAAEALSLSRSKVVKLARDGKIPSVTLPGNEVRFIESDLAGWIRSLRKGPTPGGTTK